MADGSTTDRPTTPEPDPAPTAQPVGWVEAIAAVREMGQHFHRAMTTKVVPALELARMIPVELGRFVRRTAEETAAGAEQRATEREAAMLWLLGLGWPPLWYGPPGAAERLKDRYADRTDERVQEEVDALIVGHHDAELLREHVLNNRARLRATFKCILYRHL